MDIYNSAFLKSFFTQQIILQAPVGYSLPAEIEKFILLILFLCVIIILLYVFFLITLSKTLKAIQPINREMEPGEVFLMLIPLFNYIWMFIIVNKLSSSIEKELRSRNIMTSSKPTFGMGLAVAILSVLSLVLTYTFPFGYTLLSGIAYLICLITYWSDVATYKNKLESNHHLFNIYNHHSQINYHNQASNHGYQGGYSGGHNNHGGSLIHNNQNQYPDSINKEYKSGDLYK